MPAYWQHISIKYIGIINILIPQILTAGQLVFDRIGLVAMMTDWWSVGCDFNPQRIFFFNFDGFLVI